MLKYSRQRESIKKFLMTRTDHPTAETIYENLRKEYPKISLGTIYRNLSLLTDIGEIQTISQGSDLTVLTVMPSRIIILSASTADR